MSFLAGELKDIAKDALVAVLEPFVGEAKEAAFDAAHSVIRSAIAGRMSIDEWAAATIKGVDVVKDRAVNEDGLRFVGGKLKFNYPASVQQDAVSISFQLYFLDEYEKWQMATAESSVPADKFAVDALNELSSTGEIVFDVE